MEVMAKTLKFGTEFLMIVNFAIENDDAIAVIAQDGLVPRLNVQNLEACRSQRDEARLEDFLMVWSTVDKRGRYTTDSVGVRRPIAVGKSCNSAQVVIRLPYQLQSTPHPGPSLKQGLRISVETQSTSNAGEIKALKPI